MAITPGILAEFKDRMHLEGDEDDNLTRILAASEKALLDMCGEHEIKTDEGFKELVFERARYAYNDALEFFNINFQSEINRIGMKKALAEMEDDEHATDPAAIQDAAQTELRRLAEPGIRVGEREDGERAWGDLV